MLSWEYPPHLIGGMGKHVYELVPALSDVGVEVHLVTPHLGGGPAEEQVAANAWVYRVPAPEIAPGEADSVSFAQISNNSLERKARDLLARLGRFDLVHAHDWLVAYSAVAIKYAARIPLIVTVHSTERGRGQGHLASDQALAIHGTEWWLTFEAWRVITVSQFMAQQVNDFFHVPFDKIDVINNGVRLPRNHALSEAERQALRQRYAADGEPIVYYVGRLVYEKGIHVLIDAAPQILHEYGPVKYVIAGAGNQLGALRQRVLERDIAAYFSFPGFIPDQERDGLYQIADVATFPSLYEPFGIVALEAMVHHCPVVVSATGGLAEVVKLHETGLTCYPGNPESLAWAVLETLCHPDWARARAENAYHEVHVLYSWDTIARRTRAVYEHAVQEWQHSPWGGPI
jgi:glycogen synthase